MKGATLTRDGTKSPKLWNPHGYREEGGQTARRGRQTLKPSWPLMERSPAQNSVGSRRQSSLAFTGLRLRFTVKLLGSESGNETPRRQRLEKMGNRDAATSPPLPSAWSSFRADPLHFRPQRPGTHGHFQTGGSGPDPIWSKSLVLGRHADNTAGVLESEGGAGLTGAMS